MNKKDRRNRSQSEKTTLQLLREKHKYSIKKVANYLLATEKTYASWEDAPKTIPMDNAIKLSELYNVSLDYLLNRSQYTTTGNEYIINSLGLNQTSIDTIQGLKKYSKTEDYTSLTSIDTLNYILSNPLLLLHILSDLRCYILKNEYSTLCTIEFVEGTREYKPLPYQLLGATNGLSLLGLNTDDIVEKTALENLHKSLYELQASYKDYAPKKETPDIPGQTHINDFLQD